MTRSEDHRKSLETKKNKVKLKIGTRRRSSYYVPDEIQRDIMLRLPVKSLVRFCSVNKRLRLLISTQQFITNHFKTFPCKEDELLLLHKGRPDQLSWCVFLDGLTPRHIEDVRLPYGSTNYGIVLTVGYCNGIACLIRRSHSISKYEVVLLNPSIRKVIAIPASHHLSFDLSSPSIDFGFGFGFVEDDYKLVVLPCASVNGAPLTTKVFSLKTRNWETVVYSWPEQQDWQLRSWTIVSRHAVFVDGACHWQANGFDVNGRCTNFVLSFRLSGDHTVVKIDLPINVSNSSNFSIHVYDGRLSLIVHKDELWVMNKSGAVPSWTRIMGRMYLLNIWNGKFPMVVGFTCGGGVVYSRQCWLDDGCICGELLCYNPTTQTNLSLKKNHGYELSSPVRLYAYKQNLVLLDQDVQVTEN